MNMNKTEKLLAARKRLKEFQQNKSHQGQENVPNHEKELRRKSLAQDSYTPNEAPKNTEVNSTSNQNEQTQESMKNFANDSQVSDSSNFINFADSIRNSPTINPRPLQQQSEASSFFDQNVELKVRENEEKVDENEKKGEEVGDFRMDDQRQVENDFVVVEETVVCASLSPEITVDKCPIVSENHTENGTINDSPSSQKEHLLQMASAVADALIENSDCTNTTPLETDLEYKNEFLSSYLEEQKQLVNELRVEVSRYSSRVSELEAVLGTKDAEFEAKLLREVNPLKEQLQVHAQTTGILVAEKAELSAAIEQCQTIAQRKSEQVEELSGRLKTSQSRVAELEKNLANAKSTVDDTRRMYQQLHLDYADLDKKFNEMREIRENEQLEGSELRQELGIKNAQVLTLQREIEEKNTIISLNELKIQQLTRTPQEMQALEGQHQAVVVLEQQLVQLREALKSVSQDKDEAAKQYENYVRQLDTRHEKMVKELEAGRKNIEALEDRERSYIQRLSDLEQHLQKERDKVEKLEPFQAHEERIEHLTKSLDALTREHSTLEITLNERDAEIEKLKRDLEELREMREDSVEKSKLVSALESEQLGASRAVSQNQQLKVQLNEMHDAFVMLSNSKLDLTEQLQAERTIGRKLNAQLNKVDLEIEQLKEQLRLKEVALEDMEREKLQTAQIADQMHHYQAQSHQARTLQQELQNALGCIEILRRENQQLSVQLDALRQNGINNETLSNGINYSNSENDGDSTKISGNGAAVLAEPLKKLEARFKETMERVAELTDEKQRLEHLVLQLQGETETIGEYITLYQKQRAILQKKAAEREQTFRQLVEQRNQQQEQLHQLKVLVADLIRKKSTNAIAQNPENSSVAESDNKHEDDANSVSINSEQNPTNEESVIDVKDKTTSKILDLLTEIKDCKDTCIIEPNFHPCPWCSGKLITV